MRGREVSAAAVSSTSPMMGQAARETRLGVLWVTPGAPSRSRSVIYTLFICACALFLLLGFLIELFFSISLAKYLAHQSQVLFILSHISLVFCLPFFTFCFHIPFLLLYLCFKS